jgi:uncharacterized LabA/DUF88 family protein
VIRINPQSENSYLFIDGGYLRKHYSENARKWFGCEGEIDFDTLKRHFSAQKSFYYDCLDDIRRNDEIDLDFELRIHQRETYFNKIREVNRTHARLGSLTGTAKNRRQKEVDILLAIDMMNHAVHQNVNRAILLSGDRDFKPVIESLVQLGVFVEVAGDKKHTSRHLSWAADNYIKISFDAYHNWTAEPLKSTKPVNQIRSINLPPPDVVELKKGSIDDSVLITCKDKNFYYIDVPRYKDNKRLVLAYHDLEALVLYFELQYGNIEWQ